jgi:RNA polymerase sigma-70 factor (ECF subfamily)
MTTLMAEPMPAETLVRRAKAGDRAAFEALAESVRAKLDAYLRSRIRPQLRPRLDTDELVQETAARAFESLERFEGEDLDAFAAWVTGIARNVLLKAIEKLGLNRPLKLERDVAASGPSPSKALRRDERFDRLDRAIQSLSGDHREVIRLARLEGLPLERVAERMKRSPDAVKKLLWRALKELRKAFGDTESLHLAPRRLDAGGDPHGE